MASGRFEHDVFDQVLRRHVNGKGRVDYRALAKDEQFDRYYLAVTTHSPDRDPSMFGSTEAKLAYWINAYNAATMKTVLHHYPISSVSEVSAPFFVGWFTPENSGFFYFQRPVFGGKSWSLYDLEHEVIRQRFQEPRIHFALNCASRGCPRLPQEAFVAERLEAQLDREARLFFGEERNLKIDHDSKTVYLSSILKWFREDFEGWLRKQHPDKPSTLMEYVRLHVPTDRRDEVRQAAGYQIEFTPYDWRLNDQNESAQ